MIFHPELFPFRFKKKFRLKKNLKIFHGRLLLGDQDHTKGLNFPIDLFFVDYLLPDGDGFDLLGYIQEKGIKLPIIMITGHEQCTELDLSLNP